MTKDRTKKGYLKAVNPKGYGAYHFPKATKAVIGSIFRNQSHKRKWAKPPKLKKL